MFLDAQVVADEKINNASSFLTKFEEARATMREADLMLNALLKANESANQLAGMWKQAGEELMVERASLIEEVAQLKSSIRLKEGENEVLKDQISYGLAEMTSSFSLLEECFSQTQKTVDERFNMMYSDALSMGQEMLYLVRNSSSSLEDICTKIMEKELTLFVLYQCYVGEFVSKLPHFNAHRGLYPFKHQECCPARNLQTICSSDKDDIASERIMDQGDGSEIVSK